MKTALVVWGSVGVLGGTLTSAAAHVRVNITPSIPVGLYSEQAVPILRPLPRGVLVLACPPLAAARLARQRGYLGHGPCAGDVMPIGKHIAAHTGDTVVVTATEVRVNGRTLTNSRASRADRRGRPLTPIPQGIYVLSSNTLWLAGESPDSWDSRYFGALPTTAILATMTPVWTVNTSHRVAPVAGGGS